MPDTPHFDLFRCLSIGPSGDGSVWLVTMATVSTDPRPMEFVTEDREAYEVGRLYELRPVTR